MTAAINTATGALSSATIGVDPGNYPVSAKTALQGAIANAQTVANSTTVTQTAVDNATTAMNSAITTFLNSKNGPVDKSALLAEVTTATTDANGAIVGTSPGNYPQSAVDVLNSAITSANLVVNNTLATTSDVSNAVANLKTAITTFLNSAVSVDKTLLNAAITNAKTDSTNAVNNGNIGTHPGQYPQNAFDALTAAIAVARSVSNNATATQATINAATTTMNTAIATFEKSVVGQPDKTALTKLLATANTLASYAVVGTIPGDYSKFDRDIFLQAIQTAQAVDTATYDSQVDIDNAIATLTTAMATFKSEVVGQPNKTALEASIATALDTVKANANNIGTAAGTYPQTALDALNTVIAYAQSIDNATDVTQTTVNTTKSTLDQALITFNSKVNQKANKVQLEADIATALKDTAKVVIGTRPTQYPAAAVKAFTTAIQAAQAVDKNTGLSQASVDKADADLLSAISTFSNAQIAPATKDALQQKISEATSLLHNTIGNIGSLPSMYPQSAYNALNSADSLANAIANKVTSTQLEVDNEVSTLEAAINAYNASIIPLANTQQLAATIHTADSTIQGAKIPAEYPQTAADALQQAISDASDVINNPKSTQAQVTAQESNLVSVLAAFNASKKTGIAAVQEQSITVGPVPAMDVIYVKSGTSIKRIAIVDMNGKYVITSTVSGKDTSVDLSAIPSGSYIMVITSADNSITTKAITK